MSNYLLGSKEERKNGKIIPPIRLIYSENWNKASKVKFNFIFMIHITSLHDKQALHLKLNIYVYAFASHCPFLLASHLMITSLLVILLQC